MMNIALEVEQIWPLSQVAVAQVINAVAGTRQVKVLETNEGRYICKAADESKSTEDLNSDLMIFDFLNTKGFNAIPQLIKTRGGELFHKIDGNLMYILSYIEGGSPTATPTNYYQLGRVTSELHAIQGYSAPTSFDPDLITQRDLPTLTTNHSFHREYLKLLEHLPKFQGLPTALIHTDIAPSNAIQTQPGEIVLIDWDDAGIGQRVLDVAFPLIQQFVSEDCQYNELCSKAFYDAYQEHISLTAAEKDILFDAALFIAMMYIIYGDTQKRWERIMWSIKNRSLLEEAYR